MAHLVIVLSVIAASLACAPKPGTGKTGGGGGGAGNSANNGGGGGAGNTANNSGGGGAGNTGPKRDVDHAQAIVVTKANFDPKANSIYMNVVRYTLKRFASTAKEMSALIDHAIVNCNGKPTVL